MPLVLGILVRLGLDLQTAAVALNALAAASSVALTYALGRIVLGSVRQAFGAAAVLAVSVTFVHVYSMLWSEPLFCVACLVSLCLLARMIRGGVTAMSVVAVAAGVAVACSLRFMGVVLIPVVGVSLLLATADRSPARSLAIAAIGSLASAVGEIALLVRNVAMGAPPFGPRSTSLSSPIQVAIDALSTLGQYVYSPAGSQESVLLGLLLVGLFAGGAVVIARGATGERRAAVPVFLFVCGYVALLVYSELTVDLEAIHERYLVPVLAPMLILVAAFIGRAFRSFRFIVGSTARRLAGGSTLRPADWSFRAAAAAALVAFMFGSLSLSAQIAMFDRKHGVGYNALEVRASLLARDAGSLSPHVATNEPVLVYWISGRHPIMGNQALSQTGDLVSGVRDRVASGDLTYYAWFRSAATSQGLSQETLREAGVVLHETASYPDGILFELSLAPMP
jgi:4-amino-4-deoxy-L-arabinose transferase-like glycosyltransferase